MYRTERMEEDSGNGSTSSLGDGREERKRTRSVDLDGEESGRETTIKRPAGTSVFSKREAADWAIKAYHDHYRIMPTPLHLQKVLFYWYAERLVRHQRVADFSFEAWDLGTVDRSTYKTFPGFYDQPLSPSYLCIPSKPLPREMEETLKDVVGYYGQFSVSTLSDLNHAEDPWSQTYLKRRNTLISQEAIETYYSRYPLSADKIAHQARIKEMFLELQNKTLSSQELFQMYEEFKALPEDEVFWQFMVNHGSATLTDNEDFFPFFKWPSQRTFREAVGGFLFFPRELDTMEDTVVSLYQRPRVVALLACSASFHNPLALYYLNEAFQLQNGVMPSIPISTEGEGESESEEGSSLVAEEAARLKEFSETTLSRVLETLEKAEGKEDLLMKGILAHLLGQTSEALTAFSDPSLTSTLFFRSKQGTLVRYYKAVLENDLAEIDQLAYESPTHSKRVQIAAALRRASDPSVPSLQAYYSLAAYAGSGQGYAGLARLRKEDASISQDTPEQLYRKAAKHGMLDASSALAEDALAKGAEGTQEALAYYEEAGNKGDPLAYVHLGNLYETWEDLEKARAYYKLAREAGLLNNALISPDQAESCVREAQDFFKRIYSMAIEGWPGSS